jgi:hypothetical protein
VADPEKGRLCSGRTGKCFKNVAGRERPSKGESHGKQPGMEEQVGTSGAASVQGLTWPGGEPEWVVILSVRQSCTGVHLCREKVFL